MFHMWGNRTLHHKCDKEIEEIMEKIRIENGDEIITEENAEGSSFGHTSKDDDVTNEVKDEKN